MSPTPFTANKPPFPASIIIEALSPRLESIYSNSSGILFFDGAVVVPELVDERALIKLAAP